MRAVAIKIHNFRTFADAELILSPYSLLVGANNTGKSNFIDAIRVFYEKGITYEEERDFPKFSVADKESWIEIEFELSSTEFDLLKEEYRLPNRTFRVRKYLQSGSEVDDEGKPKSGIYAYVGGTLSNSRFYGAKNVQQGKFGEVIYIPAVSKLDEHTKLTGPSALRDLVNKVLTQIIDNSPAYRALKTAFVDFESALKTESTLDGQSLQKLEEEISDEIAEWGTSFELFVEPISLNDLIKDLIGHRIRDHTLGQMQDTKSYGQGFQRYLIFTLLRLAARYNAPPSTAAKREFSPRLTWILFEEPEAFLHPSQIDALNASLKKIAEDEGSQVLISTHSPQFVSRNIEDLPSLARFYKTDDGRSIIKQVSKERLQTILTANQRDLNEWKAAGISIDDEDSRVDMESIKYALWLNPLRCNAFFADRVLLVEGATEAVLIGYMFNEGYIQNPSGGVFVLDAMGKYNIHRFMNLFGELGIRHAVLYDRDSGKPPGDPIEATIKKSRNNYTIGIDYFDPDLETYLGIPPTRPHRKPQHVMWHIKQGNVDNARLIELAKKIQKLLQI